MKPLISSKGIYLHKSMKAYWCNMAAFQVLEQDSSHAAEMYSDIFKELAKQLLVWS